MIRRALAAAGAAAALWLSAPGPGAAQNHMDKALFLELATGSDEEARALLSIRLDGVLAGLDAANRVLVRRGGERLYCPPPDAVLRADDAVARLLAYLGANPGIPDTASVAILVAAMLAETFPCPRSTLQVPR